VQESLTEIQEGARVLIMLMLCSLPANWIFAKVYQVAPSAAVAGMAVLGTLLVVLVTKSALLDGLGVLSEPRVVMALSVALTGILWVGFELGKA